MLVIASDHGGYALKQELMEHLRARNVEFEDIGTYSADSCDYPLYAEIAARGVAEISGEPLNTSSDTRRALLKAVETGSDLAVEWMYAENSVLKKTYYDGFSLCYESTVKSVCDAYAELVSAVGDCAGCAVAAHTEVSPSVYRTEFANGVVVYVNYTDLAVTMNGLEIPANGWMREEAGYEITE